MCLGEYLCSPLLCKACVGLVGLYVAYVALSTAFVVLRRLFAPSVSLKRFGAGSGDAWAVVTGASDGIGKAYAAELARKGFNVFLLARTESKLKEVASELQSKFKVETRVLAVDFTDTSIYPRIEAELAKLPRIGVLVNNVGINYDFPNDYDQVPLRTHTAIVDCNIHSVNSLTSFVLPRMLERKAGAIINLSSVTGVVPTPGLASYSATKAYILSLTYALSREYANRGIAFQAITPGFVVSNMSKFKRASLLVASAETVARGSLATVGSRVHYSPYAMHAFMEYMFTHPWLFGFFQGFIYGKNMETRSRAMKRNPPAKER